MKAQSNIKRTMQILRELAAAGVTECCVCAGARNAPFIEVLEKTAQFKVWHGFEERSMAFFALGRAKRLQKPVAIITTSGTALAETLPAVIEAQASQIPLLVVSADRPRSFRLSGSPQTMPQLDVLKTFVEKVYDLESEDTLNLADWGRGDRPVAPTLPIHINVCFAEPLLDEEVTA